MFYKKRRYNIYKDKEALGSELAAWICGVIQSTLQNQEFFTLALSGGETPQILYKKLATPEFKEKINWKRVHIFWGDERDVPFNDDRNNAKIARDLLIDHIDIPAVQVHVIRTDIEPVFAAKKYEEILHTYFDNTVKSFDLALLGIGNDVVEVVRNRGGEVDVLPGLRLEIARAVGILARAERD